MNAMVRLMLTHSWLKFTDVLLFTMCVVSCSNKILNIKFEHVLVPQAFVFFLHNCTNVYAVCSLHLAGILILI